MPAIPHTALSAMDSAKKFMSSNKSITHTAKNMFGSAKRDGIFSDAQLNPTASMKTGIAAGGGALVGAIGGGMSDDGSIIGGALKGAAAGVMVRGAGKHLIDNWGGTKKAIDGLTGQGVTTSLGGAQMGMAAGIIGGAGIGAYRDDMSALKGAFIGGAIGAGAGSMAGHTLSGGLVGSAAGAGTIATVATGMSMGYGSKRPRQRPMTTDMRR